MKGNHAPYEEWLDAFEAAYRDPSAVPKQACPNCQHRTLRLVFQAAHQGDRYGSAVFWCGWCLYGLLPSRSLMPAEVIDSEDGVPDYRIVPPVRVV